MRLRHVEQVPTFVVEGHLYESNDGRQFYVFTAGDGSVWTATEPEGRNVGRYLVGAASSRSECVNKLARVLEDERS
ncbi:MAG: hypothetical protein AB7R67_23780 [Vicinamibacterales bacterium]